MKKTVAQLADGRDIFYFDTVDDAVRTLHDPRDLPRTSTVSEMRYDPILDEWVVVAGHRQTRTFLPPANECPLCPSQAGLTSEVPSPEYDVVVFENRFPSFSTPGFVERLEDRDPDPLQPRRAGLGRCEVICFSSDHYSSLRSLPLERLRLIVDVWAERTSELSSLPNVEQVFCFENRGEEIGVTLHHPHGQIYGYPFVPPRTRRMLESARRYHERTRRNLFGDVLAHEQAAGTRVLTQTQHWTVFAPSAARWPVEVHIYPNRQVPDLPALTEEERDDFAVVYHDLLGRLDSLYGGPLPYMSCWHQAPTKDDRQLAHLHLEVFSIKRAADKLKYLASSESGMDVFISDVAPEDVIARLRAVQPSQAAAV